ncbi:lysylphosphatidylglycerol synthase domain-containing protein [Arenimonas daejeonensis]|uniref:lysylphosphatidylglycerol synthase domain-containing protein n=1 Tax=Arenimonas daejeonensis TaxID=370777 RepID=UPI00131523B2|nr:lysylphosphatidylglycerol synthase domain-containing protein [Arenimonas daejeonensis]
MNRLRRWLGWALAAALATYFVWFASRNLDTRTLAMLGSAKVLAAVVAAALLYATIIPVTAWAWVRLLARQDENWRAGQLAVMLGRIQLAKYIPGNVAQHALRATLALQAGMGGRALTVTVVQETVLAIAASVLVGVAALAISAPGLEQLPESSRRWLFSAGIALAVLVLVLSLFDLPPDRLRASRFRLARALAGFGGLPGASTVVPALAAYALNYLVIGVGLWLVARAAGAPTALDLPVATAVFALAWLLGFLAPGAPAGLGMREGIMTLLLAGVVPASDALAFVLLARVVTLVGDALIYLTSMGAILASGPGPRKEA